MSRVGILGGAFDPPHLGHRALAEGALASLALDALLVLPTGKAPHKPHSQTAPERRLELVKLAFSDLPVEVCDFELRRDRPSYTVDTLAHFAAERPKDELYFIVGGDEYRSFLSWRDPEGVLALATLAVGMRPGITDDDLSAVQAELAVRGLAGRVVRFEVAAVACSSSSIRAGLAEGGETVWLDPRVAAAIHEANPYRQEAPPPLI